MELNDGGRGGGQAEKVCLTDICSFDIVNRIGGNYVRRKF